METKSLIKSLLTIGIFLGVGLTHLNLITCEGIWNQINGSYPDRRVVFTDAIPSEGAVVVKSLPRPTV